jgi:formylglycine-generating enzyme required for sulfatase activity
VTLDAFYMDQYEITVAQYATFLNRLGTYRQACDEFDCVLPRDRTGIISLLLEEDLGDGKLQYMPLTGFSAYPINHVSWYGAKAYCEAVGARLPTEAEWEYAARGDDGRLYPWGNEAPNQNRAVFNSDNFDNLKPVDALPNGQSAFNIFGMAGSVWEWTADWYDEAYYTTSPSANPTGPETGLTRVIRGGSWPFNNEADRLRAANRSSLTPEFISSTVGFRCVSDP